MDTFFTLSGYMVWILILSVIVGWFISIILEKLYQINKLKNDKNNGEDV